MAETGNSKAGQQAAPKPKASPKKANPRGPVAASVDTTMIVEAPAPKGKAEELKSKVRDEMDSFKTKASDGARAAAEKGKDRATEAVSSIAKLIRDSAATIDQNVGMQYGDYARSAADTVDGIATKVEAKDVDQLVGEVREFVRKSPAVAVGAAAAIGFVLARLVRSGRDDA